MMPPFLRLLPAAVLALFWGGGSAAAADQPAAHRPNIIFIMADDLGYGDLGCFGSRKIHTPNLDRLAQQGTRFTQCYAGAPVCSPSRCVLLTGLHSGHGRIRDNNPVVGGALEPFAGGREGGIRLSLTAEDHTFAEILHAAGYATGAAGKWGVGEAGTAGTPLRHGFDEWLGYLNQNHAVYYYTDYLDENEGRHEIPENRDGARRVYSNDLFADFGLDFIRRHRAQPFFLYLPFTLPHLRLEVPALGEYAGEKWPADAATYAAMVTRLDRYVGQLLAELDALGLADQTLVIFTSDNGALHGERADFLNSTGGLRGNKSELYEGGIRAATIARWPGVIPAGRTNAQLWWFADIFPTFAKLAGTPPPAGLDGADVLPLLRGETRPELAHRPLYWEYPRDRLWQAVRLDQWKGIRCGLDRPLELYDLGADEREQHNVAAQHPDVVAALEKILARSHVASPHWPAR